MRGLFASVGWTGIPQWVMSHAGGECSLADGEVLGLASPTRHGRPHVEHGIHGRRRWEEVFAQLVQLQDCRIAGTPPCPMQQAGADSSEPSRDGHVCICLSYNVFDKRVAHTSESPTLPTSITI